MITSIYFYWIWKY